MGTLKQDEYRKILEEELRVNHAGELGAQYIYKGQMKALPYHHKIKQMAEQEEAHLKYFEEQLVRRGVRPSLLSPLWKLGGYVMGYVTAKLGVESAMACTESVEAVITEHYDRQLEFIQEPDLKEKIKEFRDDEMHHHDTAIEHGSKNSPVYGIMKFGISAISKLAIKIAKKI